jgi:hypothetical protein
MPSHKIQLSEYINQITPSMQDREVLLSIAKSITREIAGMASCRAPLPTVDQQEILRLLFPQ